RRSARKSWPPALRESPRDRRLRRQAFAQAPAGRDRGAAPGYRTAGPPRHQRMRRGRRQWRSKGSGFGAGRSASEFSLLARGGAGGAMPRKERTVNLGERGCGSERLVRIGLSWLGGVGRASGGTRLLVGRRQSVGTRTQFGDAILGVRMRR